MAVTELTIYLIDSSDISSIYALAKDMVVSFSQIGRLNLWFEHRYKIVSFLLTVNDYNRTDLKDICIILANTGD